MLFLSGLILPLIPWIIFSFVSTGELFYPFFTNVYPISESLSFSPIEIFFRILNSLLKSSDPISPLYIVAIPLIPFMIIKFNIKLKIVTLYTLLSLILFAVEPQTGGGRFLLPYLPIYSILVAGIIMNIKDQNIKKSLIKQSESDESAGRNH